MKTKPRILFLIHSASRNGATILLLHLLQWLKGMVDWEIEVLIRGSGPLLDEIRSLAPTTVWRSPASLLPAFLRQRMTGLQSRLEIQCLKALLAGRRFDLIYANTVAVWPLVKALSNRAPALLWHIHELVYALRLTIDNQRVSELFHATSRFVAVSSSVRDALSCEFNIRDDMMDLVQGFVPIINPHAEEQRSRRERVRKELGWPTDVFVVGGCGTLGWRKGTDLFVQIARAVSNTKGYEKVRFLWVGGGAEDKEALEFTHDLRTLGLQERCRRVPTTADVLDYYSAMDVLALTSREDPFPLVMLEAGSHSIPVVCFADSGGATEFVSEGAGLIAPYLDVAAFADHLMRLRDTPKLREQLGAAAAAKVRTNNSIAVQAPKLLKIIEQCLPNEDEKMVTRRKRSKASPVPAERL
jgi:glycosyltransferase involved in cell wall biosynthesis